MPRTKGSKNKPKTLTADFATQIAEKQSAKEALTAVGCLRCQVQGCLRCQAQVNIQ